MEKCSQKKYNVHSGIITNPQLTPVQKVQVDQLLLQYVFVEKVGKPTGPHAKLPKPGSTPVIIRTEEIPVVLHNAYDKEID